MCGRAGVRASAGDEQGDDYREAVRVGSNGYEGLKTEVT